MGCASSSPASNDDSKPKPASNPSTVKPDTGAEEDDVFAVATPTLDAKAKESVSALFQLWDLDKQGKLEIKAFKKAAIKIGPHESRVLSQLADMDLDGDGFVDSMEWDTWFAACGGALSLEEFKVVIEDMTEAANAFVFGVVTSRAVTSSATGGPEDEDDLAQAAAPLPAPRASAVRKLFLEWDFKSEGFIDRDMVGTASVNVGPHQVNIFSQLVAMDTDNDHKITFEEMAAFFTVVSPSLSDDEFNEVIVDMTAAAQHVATVNTCVSLAMETPRAESGLDEEDALPPPPELSGARKAKVEALYSLLAKGSDSGILLASLGDCSTKVGLHEVKLLKELQDMDANLDGLLTFEEMLSYFTKVGPALNDEEFELTVDDMITSATANNLAAQVSSTSM